MPSTTQQIPISQADPLPNSLLRFLFLTAASTGAGIMVIEILGAKLLTPYFGSSHFVWTAQIAVTLASLAVGYYLGGKLVDGSPSLHRIYYAILGAALYVAASVPVIEPLSRKCLSLSLPVGSLVAAIALFFVPLALLAMVGPFFARVLVKSTNGIGGVVGKLSAISTLGSLIGTLLIGYVLLPLASNTTTLCATAVILASLPLIYFAVWNRHRLPQALIAWICIFLLGAIATRLDHLVQFEGLNLRARKNSNFGELHVVDAGGGIRYYLNDFLTQNSYHTTLKESGSLFTYMLEHLSHAYSPNISNALCIGMGIGIVPMKLASKGIKVDVVEINPDVVPIASQFFDFDPSKVRLTIGDGRQFLQTNPGPYDTIILDAFLGDSSPSHLLTSEAFQSIKKALTTHGTLVINAFGSFEKGKDFFLSSLEKTLINTFQNVKIHASGNGNTFLVASSSPLRVHHPIQVSSLPRPIQSEVQTAWEGIQSSDPTSGIILTDNFNPVEFHDAKNREEFRRILATSITRKQK